ncbi:hypothetical protein TNCV_2288881 [Trichonephila clavipes]|uniref:Uncharacterized protein n=1 Tax=Trichonephila clavipes TaxID=2585209 RepID=A0A8X6V1R5_TRICX|nr:hypothetical protein TNCV_2288881 [Trichonephila clavipes]
MVMMQDSESNDFSDNDYREVDIENSGSDASVCSLHFVCKSGGSRLPKQVKMELIEKIISENHSEFSATSGRPSINLLLLRLTSGHFSDVVPATEKKNRMQQDSALQ